MTDKPTVDCRVVHFSCGAASAIAAKLTLTKHPDALVVNAFVAEEHPDNRRFLADVERWTGKPITVLRQERDGASAYAIMRREHYITGIRGAAPCSRQLKRELLDAWSPPNAVHVLGYTAEEARRAERVEDANNKRFEFPLIDAGLTKADCLAMLHRADIEPPAMYALGYNNANCIGCPHGGMGYWNKIRRDFPERFAEMVAIEAMIGPTAYLFYNRETGGRFPLTELDPNAGRHNVVSPECGFFCLMAENVINAADATKDLPPAGME